MSEDPIITIEEPEDPIEVAARSIAVQDDEEYRKALEIIEGGFPSIEARGVDLSKLKGKLSQRTGKSIVIYLFGHGWSVMDIAEGLGVNRETIYTYLSTAIGELVPVENLALAREVELQRLDAVARDAWEQFERSCEDAVTEQEGDVDGKAFSKTTRKGQTGNPAYLRLMLDISKHRAALKGLEAPRQVQVDKNETKLIVREIVVTNRAEALAAKNAGLLK